MKLFLETLFKSGEYVCPAHDRRETKSLEISDLGSGYKLITINPLKPLKKRADDNVAEFRNFLVEMDQIDLKEQLDLFETFPIKFNAITYSGGKSYHGIICVKESFKDKSEWSDAREMLWEAFNIHAKSNVIDKNVFRAANFTRFPGGVRENGKTQQLYYVNPKKITKKDFLEGLEKITNKDISNYKTSKPIRPTRPIEPFNGWMPSDLSKFFREGWTECIGDHKKVYWATEECKRIGLTKEECIYKFQQKGEVLNSDTIRQINNVYSE